MSKKKVKKYKISALIYDRLMNKKYYKTWRNLIVEIIDKYKIDKGIALDLACGTGNVSKILFDLRFKVIGIDSSPAMLEVAKKKLPLVQFIESDMRNFKIAEADQVKLAVSLYDSLNYLTTKKDLLVAFKNIALNISKGAIILFDINPKDKILVAQHFKDQTYDYDDFSVCLHYGGKNKFWTIDFVIIDKKTGEIFTEHHIESGYNKSDIATLIKQANFSLLEVRRQTKQDDDGKSYLNRLYFVARKG